MPMSVEDGERLIALEAHIKRLEQGATSAPPLQPTAQSQPPTPAMAPSPPSPWQALKGAFTGTQRLPFQSGAPEEGTDPAALGETAGKDPPLAK